MIQNVILVKLSMLSRKPRHEREGYLLRSGVQQEKGGMVWGWVMKVTKYDIRYKMMKWHYRNINF